MSKRKAASQTIPDAALMEHIAVVGKTGSGKTYTAKGIVERLLAGGQRVCILDPTGAWWGLRTAADGKKPGFPVTIFGGDHGDVLINEHAGEAVAKLLAGSNIPAIIDLSDTWLAERRRFAEKFFETLFKSNRGPQQRILDALAWWTKVGVGAPSRAQVGFVAGIKPQGGHFTNTVGPLKTAGLVEYPTPGSIALTGEGRAAAEWPAVAPTLEVYQRGMLDMLKTGPQRKIIEVLINHGPGRTIDREQLGQQAGINPNGGHFTNTVGPLRTLGLVEYPKAGCVRATGLVWPEALLARGGAS